MGRTGAGDTTGVGVSDAKETVVEGPKLLLSCFCLTVNGVQAAVVTACVGMQVLDWLLQVGRWGKAMACFCSPTLMGHGLTAGPWGTTAASTCLFGMLSSSTSESSSFFTEEASKAVVTPTERLLFRQVVCVVSSSS